MTETKETFVPFKPEPGRPVYCKDCIAKMKTGEIKPIRGAGKQDSYDESKFFKPLSDLGIEFASKDVNSVTSYMPKKVIKPIPSVAKPNIFSTVRKVFQTPILSKPATSFNKPVEVKPQPKIVPPVAPKPRASPVGGQPRDTSALKEILNKALSETISPAPPVKKDIPEEVKRVEPEPISLNTLKEKTAPTPSAPIKDKSASAEDMDKFKKFIEEKSSNTLTPPEAPKKKAKASPVEGLQPREVPEDVLRKILE